MNYNIGLAGRMNNYLRILIGKDKDEEGGLLKWIRKKLVRSINIQLKIFRNACLNIPISMNMFYVLDMKNGLKCTTWKLVSLYFDIALHPLQIQKWTQKYQVELHNPSETILLKNALKVVAALKFNGRIIALFEKGNKDISISSNDLIEITESYNRFEQISNTSLSNPVEDEDFMVINDLDKDDMLGRTYPGVEKN